MLSRRRSVSSWITQAVVAGILFQTLFFKFRAAEESVYIFRTLGMEPWGRIGSGAAELVAGILLLVPATAAVGALLALEAVSKPLPGFGRLRPAWGFVPAPPRCVWHRVVTAPRRRPVSLALGPAKGILKPLLGIISVAIVSHLTVLGIEVQGDGGLLFGLAVVVLVGSALIVFLRRHQLPVIRSNF
jgi:hypothetical protein